MIFILGPRVKCLSVHNDFKSDGRDFKKTKKVKTMPKGIDKKKKTLNDVRNS